MNPFLVAMVSRVNGWINFTKSIEKPICQPKMLQKPGKSIPFERRRRSWSGQFVTYIFSKIC